MYTCRFCGRTTEERVMGLGPGGMRLCHANLDGTKSNPDCYHLVTVWGVDIGLPPVRTGEV